MNCSRGLTATRCLGAALADGACAGQALAQRRLRVTDSVNTQKFYTTESGSY